MSMRSKLARSNWYRAARAGTAMAGLLLVAGCSTDVQRFGYTGSLPAAGAVSSQGFNREPVRTGSLSPPPAPFASPAPQPAPAGRYSGNSIQVRSGDTIYSLARQKGVSVEELASANGMAYPYGIKIGQTLRVPANRRYGARRIAPDRAGIGRISAHTVAPGDTLYSVSRRYNVGVSELASANDIADDGTIKVGQSLRIPKPGEQTARGGPLVRLPGQTTLKPAGKARRLASKTGAPKPVAPIRTAANQNRESIGPLPAPPERTSSRFRWPVRGRLISNFGVGQNGKRNDGINILVPAGASVKSAENGVVAYVGNEIKGYGNLILVRHSNDWVTAYAHNSEILVDRGDTVKRGQIIARAGKSGSVTKPQVHFEIRKGAKAVNPMNYLEET